MIKLMPSKNPEVILRFIKGTVLGERLIKGACINGMAMIDAIKSNRLVFLVAIEDGTKGLGFVILKPDAGSATIMDVCLRSAREKTKKIIALAMHYAKYVMGTSTIYTIYPSTYRACDQLAKFFGFKDDAILRGSIKLPCMDGLCFKRLDI